MGSGGVMGGFLRIFAPKVLSNIKKPMPQGTADTSGQEAEGSAGRDSGRVNVQQTRGMGGTVLTSTDGVLGKVDSVGTGLLGRSGVR